MLYVIHITLLSAIYITISLSSTRDDYEISWNRVELIVTPGLRGIFRFEEIVQGIREGGRGREKQVIPRATQRVAYTHACEKFFSFSLCLELIFSFFPGTDVGTLLHPEWTWKAQIERSKAKRHSHKVTYTHTHKVTY